VLIALRLTLPAKSSIIKDYIQATNKLDSFVPGLLGKMENFFFENKQNFWEKNLLFLLTKRDHIFLKCQKTSSLLF